MNKTSYKTMFLLGQYGSGKDTHGPFIAEKFGLQHISFSSFLAQDHSVRSYMELGHLVPDDDVFRILETYPLDGYLFNGFPRTLPQLEFVLSRFSVHDIAIVYLDVADAVVIHRMTHRMQCSICKTPTSSLKGHVLGGPCKVPGCSGILQQRPDDTPENIVRRMQIFREKTLPIIDVAMTFGVRMYCITISSEQPIASTQDMIANILDIAIHA